MTLEKYLADYIDHELDILNVITNAHLQEVIKQGLDAFESTEDVTALKMCKESFRCIMEWRNGKEQDWQQLAGQLEEVLDEVFVEQTIMQAERN